jgi:hypothetical protein
LTKRFASNPFIPTKQTNKQTIRLEEIVSRVLESSNLAQVTQMFTDPRTGLVNYRALVRRVRGIGTSGNSRKRGGSAQPSRNISSSKTNMKVDREKSNISRVASNLRVRPTKVIVAKAVRQEKPNLQRRREQFSKTVLSASRRAHTMSRRPVLHAIKTLRELEEKLGMHLSSRPDALQV